MIRAGLCAIALSLGAARPPAAAPPPTAEFPAERAADVFATALDFIAPRTLVPVSLAQLTSWGLRGLTALDPVLVPVVANGRVRLFAGARLLFDAPAPEPDDADGWGDAAALVEAAGWAVSPAVQRAGGQNTISGFFEEIFDRLDPYSRYVPPAEVASERNRAREAGIGVTVRPERGSLAITQVVPEGPAAAAGLRPGDRLLAVDGKRVDGRNVGAAIAALAGADDAPVALRVRSPRGALRQMSVRRTLLPPETVFAEHRAGLLVLRLTGFNEWTGKRLELALLKGLAARQRPRGVVLDLRGNRGGLLRQAVEVAGLVLGTGLVATTVGRNPAAKRTLEAEGVDLSEGLPVIVLVDGGSASAAEIVAAALADDRRAVVVGSVTQGKGLIQAMAELPDGGELFVTWSQVLAPLGWPIQDLGVLPQICTSFGRAELRRQLAMASKGEQPMEKAIALNRTAAPSLPLADIVAIRDACPAAEGNDADLAAARFLVLHPPAYRAALIPAQLLPASPLARSP